jgi:hypothetical protein
MDVGATMELPATPRFRGEVWGGLGISRKHDTKGVRRLMCWRVAWKGGLEFTQSHVPNELAGNG